MKMMIRLARSFESLYRLPDISFFFHLDNQCVEGLVNFLEKEEENFHPFR